LTKKGLALRLLIAALILGGAGALTFRLFFMRAARVPTGAMSNTIIPGDHVFIYKLLGQPNRGDVVTFQRSEGSETFISRIIGLPGETLQVQGKLVYINGRVLDEQRVLAQEIGGGYEPLTEVSSEGSGPYRVYYTRLEVDENEPAPEFGVATPFHIPDNSYFLLGDNRDNSEDSRYHGAVPSELIWGRASVIYYSVKEPSLDEVRWERIFKRVQ